MTLNPIKWLIDRHERNRLKLADAEARERYARNIIQKMKDEQTKREGVTGVDPEVCSAEELDKWARMFGCDMSVEPQKKEHRPNNGFPYRIRTTCNLDTMSAFHKVGVIQYYRARKLIAKTGKPHLVLEQNVHRVKGEPWCFIATFCEFSADEKRHMALGEPPQQIDLVTMKGYNNGRDYDINPKFKSDFDF